MDILHVATELTPFAKVGGLADVASALTKNLRLLGHRVTLAMPRYPAFAEAGLLLGRRLTPLTFELGGTKREATLYDGKLASGVELLLIDIPELFSSRAGIYGEDGVDYPDNAERFGAFSKAVVELTQQRAATGTPFALVHAHDWPTALVPYYLARGAKGAPPTVLTIHNLAYQGIVTREQVPELGISWDDFTMDGVEFFGSGNLLKAGIVTANALTTVSEQYARDIVTKEYGARLDGVLRSRKDSLTGIVNGVDSSVWNPATDVALPARYDVEDITNKARNKGALLAEVGLAVDAATPLAVFVGRLVDQKGADLLLGALSKIVATGMRVAIAGEGDHALAEKLQNAAGKHAGDVVFLGNVAEGLAHRLFAAADFALVPSRFEPCGLVQLYAQRYGALPVAHAVGGLRDTVIDCDASLETGTGFLFDEPTSAGLLGAVQRARSAYDSARFRGLLRRVMRLDRGWERPARRYEQIYRTLVTGLRGQIRGIALPHRGHRHAQPRSTQQHQEQERELMKQRGGCLRAGAGDVEESRHPRRQEDHRERYHRPRRVTEERRRQLLTKRGQRRQESAGRARAMTKRRADRQIMHHAEDAHRERAEDEGAQRGERFAALVLAQGDQETGERERPQRHQRARQQGDSEQADQRGKARQRHR